MTVNVNGIQVFIGYDPRETVAYHVLAHSILKRARGPVAITPLNLKHLKPIHGRDKDPLQSTDFAITRFLTPFLSNYSGYSIFMDCDMLCLDDIYSLPFKDAEDIAVHVVKHNHVVPDGEQTKFLGAPQTAYKRKNWSSLMLFNNSHDKCRQLTPTLVDMATGLSLHQFRWCKADEIGELPRAWNHLVGVEPHNPGAKIVHYTLGGPYFGETDPSIPYYNEWWDEFEDMMSAAGIYRSRGFHQLLKRAGL